MITLKKKVDTSILLPPSLPLQATPSNACPRAVVGCREVGCWVGGEGGGCRGARGGGGGSGVEEGGGVGGRGRSRRRYQVELPCHQQHLSFQPLHEILGVAQIGGCCQQSPHHLSGEGSLCEGIVVSCAAAGVVEM